MILAVVRTGFLNLRRDRAALALTFVMPIAFFSIFAMIFGSQRITATDRVRAIVVDEDRSEASQRLLAALERGGGVRLLRKPASSSAGDSQTATNAAPEYTVATAEAAVRAGTAPAAIIIPQGFGAAGFSFDPSKPSARVRILSDSSDPVAPQLLNGLLQKAAYSAMPTSMAREGMKYFEQYAGGLTPQQRSGVEKGLGDLDEFVRKQQSAPPAKDEKSDKSSASSVQQGLIGVEMRDVLGETKKNPLIAMYAAGIGVMFLLFRASGAGGVLLEEAESGTLDRILATRVSMTRLMLGKHAFLTLLGVLELTFMFIFAALVFKVELMKHWGGFLIMTLVSAAATASFGLVLAAACRTRAQLAPLSTILVLMMSAVGGSMVPRFLMPEAMQRAGLFTLNGWAIDGFNKVFWREEPLVNLVPAVAVLLGVALVLLLVARRLARKWEFA
jgi:ABC-2 type transport system permease protein